MDKQCYNCHIEAEWQEHYILAVRRFDKFMNKALAMMMIAVVKRLKAYIVEYMPFLLRSFYEYAI